MPVFQNVTFPLGNSRGSSLAAARSKPAIPSSSIRPPGMQEEGRHLSSIKSLQKKGGVWVLPREDSAAATAILAGAAGFRVGLQIREDGVAL